MYKYTVSDDRKVLIFNFKSKSLCEAVGRFDFCSRLLYELTPDNNGVWKSNENGRLNAYIKGFPPEINWKRTAEKTLEATSNQPISKMQVEDISIAIKGVNGHKENDFTKKEYTFSIVDSETKEEFEYKFLGRARSVVAFCVLWDLANHPRNHLEVSKPNNLKFLAKYPQSTASQETRLYGDPSKTVDELRNEGFPRDTDQSERGTYINVSREDMYGNKQEHYQLLNRQQSLIDRVGRSQIPDKYKSKLYEKSNYTCMNCGQQYEQRYLAPDHRVPSIVEADNLNQHNFLDVLQTLCVRCNQVKRESCKKCQYEHNCSQCAWAYPERYGITEATKIRLEKIAKSKGLLTEELMVKIAEKLEKTF